MNVEKCYSVRGITFRKIVYIMQKGVWYKLGKNLKGKELGAGLYQRKDGKYCGRFYDRFGIRRYVYGKTISETKEKLNTAMYEDKMEMNVADNTVTLNEWYQKWLEMPYTPFDRHIERVV